MKLGIITTTYNREKLLDRLYESLNNQINQNFVWIVVDDGSIDNTSTFIHELDSRFEIRYFYKENDGKAKALNYAFINNQDIDLYIVVDSDDYLLENATVTIKNTALKYRSDNIGGLFFKYQFKNGEVLGNDKNTYTDSVILTRIEHDAKFDKIDGCICYFNKAIKKYNYPEFENEKYVGPTVLQMIMAKEFKIVFLNNIIGVAEYQEGGITDSGRLLRIKSPKSMIVYSHYMQDSKFNILTRIKHGIMANAYYYIEKKNNKNDNEYLFKKNKIPKILRMPGTILGIYWKLKYGLEDTRS